MTKFALIFWSIFLLQFALIAPSLAEISAPDCFRKRKQFEFVSNGKAKYPVILGTQMTPRTLEAVEDLKYYVRKISGAELTVLSKAPSYIPEKAIWIGFHPELKKLFKKTDFNLKAEEVLILISKNHLAILGNDGDGKVTDIEIEGTKFANAQSSYGTINAIYTFLQEFLGVRWFMPNELGEDYIESKTLRFKPQEYRFTPVFLSRYGVNFLYRPGRREKIRPGDLWSIRHRLFYSSVIVEVGHPFKDWWRKYSKKFPNVFALTEENDRKPLKRKEDVKLCLSSPELHALWFRDLEERLIQNPFLRFINVGENDSYHTGHCLCGECVAWDGMDIRRDDKNLSDRNVKFVNALQGILDKKFGKNTDLKVLYSAYGNARYLPIKAKLNPKVGVVSVANFHLRRGKTLNGDENEHISDFLNWSDKTEYVFWRPNLGNPVGLQWGFFDVAFSQSFENFKFVAERNGKGIYFDMYFDHWATQGIQYYIDAQLAWNPYLNREDVLNDYFNRFYGPAADEMKSFWMEVEQKRNKLYSQYPDKEAKYWIFEAFSLEWFNERIQSIKSQISKLDKSQNKYKKRLEFTLSGVEHSKLLVQARETMHQYESTKNDSLAKQVMEIWAEIDKLSKKAPQDAINYKTLRSDADTDLERKHLKRMNGLIVSSPKRIRNKKKEDDDDSE